MSYYNLFVYSKSFALAVGLLSLSVAALAEKPGTEQVSNPQQAVHGSAMLGQFDINSAEIGYDNPESGAQLDTKATRALVLRLLQTRALNQDEINAELKLIHGERSASEFAVSNPYYPVSSANAIPLPKSRSITRDSREIINPEGYDDPREGYTEDAGKVIYFQQPEATRWFSAVRNGLDRAQQVCAIKFSDSQQQEYQLRTFDNLQQASAAGWTVTHQYQCGTCSTLQDLAVYIGIPNQTAPISACTRQAQGDINKLAQVKQCIVEAVGFTEMCAETWAYNGVHTGANCRDACIAAAGKPLVVNPETGQLNSCLWCDERVSGPGFKYSAGRTRRGSGLESAIARPNDRLFYQADHSAYFSSEE